RVERGLLRSGCGLAGDLREARRRQPAEYQGNASVATERAAQRVGDILLVLVEAASGLHKIERQIEVGMSGVVAETRPEIHSQIANDCRIKDAVDPSRRAQDRVPAAQGAGKNRIDGRAAG